MKRRKLITEVITTDKLKSIISEIFFNTTNKVSKITDNSIINAHFYAISRLAQKALSNIAIHESRIFTDTASGQYLDDSATLFGAGERLGASKSSTFIKVYADPGTRYIQGVHQFRSISGISFDITETKTVNDNGYGYIPVISTTSGANTQVDANTITRISPKPVGHISCSNEYMAVGGSDVESDEDFRIRIKSSFNVLSSNTLGRLLSVLRLINNNIVRVFRLGYIDSKYTYGVVTRDGGGLSSSQLSELAQRSKEYLSSTDVSASGELIGLSFVNIDWDPITIDFRAEIPNSYNFDDIRREIQINLTKYFDYRYWEFGKIISRAELIYIISSIEGVEYIPDEHFIPGSDRTSEFGTLPRIFSFIMRDLNGNILYTATSQLDIYYSR